MYEEIRPEKVIVSEKELRGIVARWAVQLSPYVEGPDNLGIVLTELTLRFRAHPQLQKLGHMNYLEFPKERRPLYVLLDQLLISQAEVQAWNKRKNGRPGNGYGDRYTPDPDPDDDFIDLLALSQNIVTDLVQTAR